MNYIVLIKLLLAHVVGDFLLQNKDFCAMKRNLRSWKGWGAQLLHAFFQAVLAYVFVMDWGNWIVPSIIFGSHMLIDLVKSWLGDDDNFWHFIWDQLVHLVVMVVLSYSFISITPQLPIKNSYVVVILAYVLITIPSSIFICKFYNQWNSAGETKNPSSLPRGGEYIGILERVLILTFILVGYPEGIGFLLAAKSVFRFGDLQKGGELKLTEYVLIGTFLSFAIAIMVGYCALKLMKVVNM